MTIAESQADATGGTALNVNYAFMLSNIVSRDGANKILDYGCGAGDIVVAARSLGAEVVGVEKFYAASDSHAVVSERGLLGKSVFPLDGDRIPFPDSYFDLIVSNQVLEHVEDLDVVLAEFHRVLKPGGDALLNFPSAEVLREGHIGIPLAHKIPPGPIRYAFVYTCRLLGMGFHKQGKSIAAWTTFQLSYLDSFTRYRPKRVIHEALARHGFQWQHDELSYIRFRLRSEHLRKIAALLRPLSEYAFQRLAHMVLRIQKNTTDR